MGIGCSMGKSVEQGKKIKWHDETTKQIIVIPLP